MRFANRHDAGRRLAAVLRPLTGQHPVVLGLPRGGVPVAFEVAEALDAPLDVLVVRKLGCPWQPELGVGALGEGGVRILNEPLIESLGLTEFELRQAEQRERRLLEERLRRYRGERPPIPVRDRLVIVVDDGLATGFTARAGVAALRQHGADRIVLAVPVAPRETVAELRRLVDDVVCLQAPAAFWSIGEFYDDFSQTSDDEVAALLDARGGSTPSVAPTPTASVADDPAEEVWIRADGRRLPGLLQRPGQARGIVLFAHGSGSSRHSPRNLAVANELVRGGLATLLFDLLTAEEAANRARVFDIELLADRLLTATEWARARPELAGLPVGYFGASTGAAAALWAAADLGEEIAAVVSRGGRPDLAEPRLAEVRAPTLLIVGSRDEAVLDLNRLAARSMRAHCELEVVPGATHLFEEPGALELVAELARDWFRAWLAAERTPR